MNNNAMEQIETASVDELRSLQLERMKKTLQHAYQNITVYKKKFDEAGVHPDDLKSLEDLAKFPFTTKQDLRENYPFGMFAVPQEQIVRVHASSGTTGQLVIPRMTLIPGQMLWHARYVQQDSAIKIRFRYLMDTACLLVA